MGNSPQIIKNFSSLLELYDLFLFDLCGIIHDGHRCFPQSIELIESLKKLNKAFAFISNSAQKKTFVRKFLLARGLDLSDEVQIVTTIEFFCSYAKANLNLFQNKKVYFLGKTLSFSKDLKINQTDSIDEADYLFFSLNSLEKNDTWKDILQKAKQQNMEGFCLNPDITAPHKDSIIYTPGYYAKNYENIGGKVKYFGKPYQDIYLFLLNNQNHKIKNNRILAVGDSLLTDIKGANKLGIDSLLVYSKGVHQDIDFQNRDITFKICAQYKAHPTYILNFFS